MRWLALLAALLALPAWASPIETGAEAFEGGDAGQAIALWGEAAREGRPSGVLLYDLGVAFYRLGDRPRAVAYWRAARELRPRDPELVHNLARARNDLEGTPEPVAAPAGWMEFLTLGELGVFGLLLLALGVGGLGWRRWWRPQALRLPWLLLAGIGLVAAGAAAWAGRAVVATPVAVVVDGEAVGREFARLDAAERFTLPPGSEVRVRHRIGTFVLIETGDGQRGWVPRSAVIAPGPGRRVVGPDPRLSAPTG